MRKIKYIFIDSDCQNDSSKSGHRAVSLFRHHFTITKEGLVLNPIDISQTVNLIEGPIYDPDKYNECAISIHYCGSLEPGTLRSAMPLGSSKNFELRAKLIRLLVELRSRFPDAKILGVSELDGKAPYYKNIIVSDTMNLLRRELSEL